MFSRRANTLTQHLQSVFFPRTLPTKRRTLGSFSPVLLQDTQPKYTALAPKSQLSAMPKDVEICTTETTNHFGICAITKGVIWGVFAPIGFYLITVAFISLSAYKQSLRKSIYRNTLLWFKFLNSLDLPPNLLKPPPRSPPLRR